MEDFTTIYPDSISVTELHKILLNAVAPRPIAFASTMSKSGKVNLSPFSYFNVFSANPPILIFSPARRVRKNTIKHTLENIKETKEVVINIVNFPIVEQMSLASTEYDADTNEFVKSGLTEVPSLKVAAPRVLESPVAFECIVNDIIELGKEGGAGNLVICEVVLIHVNNKYVDHNNQLDIKKLDLVARMGGNWYTRCTEDSLFEIPKPIHTLGIGVDKLPEHIYKTDILSGNDLGKLGSFNQIPTKAAVEVFKKEPGIVRILAIYNEQIKLEKLHYKIKEYLSENNVSNAMLTLCCF